MMWLSPIAWLRNLSSQLMAGEVSDTSLEGRTRLEEVSIKGLGVIDNATIEFAPGLNVITGETGAGKTMVLTALSLVLGGKTDLDLLRKGAERLIVSGRFSATTSENESLRELIKEHEVELDDGSLLLARTLNSEGKSRATLCGITTTASVLASFAAELIEIHGQHGTLQLSKAHRQRELLDRFGGKEIEAALNSYQRALAKYEDITIRIEDLKKSLLDRDREITDLKELLAEFAKLKPVQDELQHIDMEVRKLESVEDIRIALSTVLEAINGEESGADTSLGTARRALQAIRDKDPVIESAAAKIESAYFEATDAASELRHFLENLAADPARLEALLNRRAALRSFAKRFGTGSGLEEALSSALERAELAKTRMKDLGGGESRVEELLLEQRSIFDEMVKAAKVLSQSRNKHATSLSAEVTKEIRELAMPKAAFQCRVSEVFATEGNLELVPLAKLNRFGNDEIEMLFTAHADGEPLPISKAASGGELSRLMLALEVVVAATSPRGTYLFDEIDAGIGGRAALEVGKRLKRLSKSAQIIVVTHLPQVAIWGDNHLRVLKDSNGSITESSVTVVTGGERESEIARMLSGLEDSEHAQDHARELLDLVNG
ncbi:MAG: DNA repair protein RecN [Actinobacteria bacterium]|nr:DNA repair protein RecN [Actinomycetota bacterium]NCW96646.1 DNA repair protein RecN [Actinomycetota bacterium]